MSLFRSLLPGWVAVAELDPADVDERALTDEERPVVAAAVEQRRRQFAAGRLLARRLLGERARPLLRGPDGAPLWPPGVRGSVTHCDRLAAVAVGDACALAGVGIDAELAAPLPEGVGVLVLTRADAAWLDRLVPGERGLAERIVFSAKESIYKAQHARSRAFLDFADVDLQLDLARGTFRGVLRVDVRGYPAGTVFHGRHAVDRGLIGTAVVIKADDR